MGADTAQLLPWHWKILKAWKREPIIGKPYFPQKFSASDGFIIIEISVSLDVVYGYKLISLHCLDQDPEEVAVEYYPHLHYLC